MGCELDRKIDDLIRAAGFQINSTKTCPLASALTCGLVLRLFFPALASRLLKIRDRSRTGDRRDDDQAASGSGARCL